MQTEEGLLKCIFWKNVCSSILYQKLMPIDLPLVTQVLEILFLSLMLHTNTPRSYLVIQSGKLCLRVNSKPALKSIDY